MSDKEKKNGEKTSLGKKLLSVLIIALVFAASIVGTLFAMDKCSHKTEELKDEPKVVTITVLGDKIKLEDGTLLSYGELERYLDTIYEKGELSTVALITDTAEPADIEVYNEIVQLLKKYGIECKPLEIPSTYDEATKDEI